MNASEKEIDEEKKKQNSLKACRGDRQSPIVYSMHTLASGINFFCLFAFCRQPTQNMYL